MRHIPLSSCVVLQLVLLALPLCAQSPENVLVVVNESSPVSLEVGQYYAEKRGVPASNIVRIKTTPSDTVAREVYNRQIEAPVSTWLGRNSAQDKILYIVLTKGIPLRIGGTSGAQGTIASVDSELTLLYRKLTGQSVPIPGMIPNPYFLGTAPVPEAKRFTHEFQDIYLVCRLDGYSSADVRALIDRGLNPAREGKILLDQKESLQEKGNVWLRGAAETLERMGFKDRVVLETTARVLTNETGVMGYYSWGSNDPAIRIRHFNFGFVAGALGGMFVSSDGRTFSEPPVNWNIGSNWNDKNTQFAGSPQSMAGDLIHDGITGVAGHVAEPYLEAAIRPNILFPAYLSGFNLIESYYLAMPYLSWQTVVVGDPLCAPFRTKALGPEEIDKGMDSATELPGYFGSRRLRNISLPAYKQAGVHPDAIKLVLRAEARMAKQDQIGARQALEDATSKDSRLASAQLLLALLYEQSKEYDKAITRYRRVLELSPSNAAVMNNLAYDLAVHKNSPKEALPLAEKAYEIAKGSPSIADTLGWIHHQLGNSEKAVKLIEEALRGGEENPDIQLHAAMIHAAAGQMLQAAKELAKATELSPDIENREEVQQLRKKLHP